MPTRNLVQPALAERHAGGATTLQRRSAQGSLTRIDMVVRRIQREYVQTPELRLTLETYSVCGSSIG
jgi:hypothetical protein